MSHSLCKQAANDLRMITEYMETHETITDSMAISYLLNRAVCMDKKREEDWMKFHKDVYGAEYPTSTTAHHTGAITHEEATEWVKCMKGTNMVFTPWTVAETSAVAKTLGIQFTSFTDWCFNLVMNMMRSDYGSVLGDSPDLYGKMAKAFIMDSDTIPVYEKLEVYYKHIVKH